MKHTVISPHLDDAVLSLGQWLAATPGTTVVTVFAGIPDGGLSAYDEASGFTDSRTAMEERRAEDEKACRSLAAQPRHLGFLDRQYETIPDLDAITATLAGLWTTGTRVYAPLGIGHPDHAVVAACAREACPEELIVYEDFPYRTLWPEQVYPALERVKNDGFHLEPFGVDQGNWMAKRNAIMFYGSQYGVEDVDDSASCLFVPERAWRAIR